MLLRIASFTLKDSLPVGVQNLGQAIGYVPIGSASINSGDVYQSELWHGLSTPTLLGQAPSSARDVAKNATTSLADLK